MKTELDISQFQTSLIISVFSISAAIMIPILGYLSDRFSRKAVVIPSLIIYGLRGILAGVAAAWFSNAYTWILAAGVMHAGIGNVDYLLMFNLLLGSIPGVIFGSTLSVKLSVKPLRAIMALIILISGLKLI